MTSIVFLINAILCLIVIDFFRLHSVGNAPPSRGSPSCHPNDQSDCEIEPNKDDQNTICPTSARRSAAEFREALSNKTKNIFERLENLPCALKHFEECGYNCSASGDLQLRKVHQDENGMCREELYRSSFECDVSEYADPNLIIVATEILASDILDEISGIALEMSLNENHHTLIRSTSPLLAINLFLNSTSVSANNVNLTMDVSGDVVPDGAIGNADLISDISYVCAFLNESSKKLSTEGCRRTNHIEGKAVTCECNHTTIFAVLMSVKPVFIPRGVRIASYVVESISVVSLLFAFGFLMYVRRLIKGDRINIQMSLVSSLFLLHSVSLLHDAAVQNSVSCVFVAIAMHFLLLAAAMWMLMEGTSLLVKTTKLVLRYHDNAKKVFWIRHVLCWGIPALIVTVSAAVGFSNSTYMTVNPATKVGVNKNSTNGTRAYNQCWLTPASPIFMGSVMIPLAVIIFVNFLIVVRLAYVAYKMGSETRKFRPMSQRHRQGESGVIKTFYLRESLKFAIILTPVLGLPWVIGFLVAIEGIVQTEIFLYMHLIINGCQGLVLLILYCVIATEVKVALRRKLRQRVDSIEFFSRIFTDSKSKRTGSCPEADVGAIGKPMNHTEEAFNDSVKPTSRARAGKKSSDV